MDTETLEMAIKGYRAEIERLKNHIRGLYNDLSYCDKFTPKGIWKDYDSKKTPEENYEIWKKNQEEAE